jgi:hypothetical protein
MTGELIFKINCDTEETIIRVTKLISKGLHDGLLVIPSDLEIMQKKENGEWERL